MSGRRVDVATGHPGADRAAGATAGAAPDGDQVAVAQGTGRGATRGAVGGEAGRNVGLGHGIEAVHLLMGMPNASSMLSIAACATRGGTLGNEPRLPFPPGGRRREKRRKRGKRWGMEESRAENKIKRMQA